MVVEAQKETDQESLQHVLELSKDQPQGGRPEGTQTQSPLISKARRKKIKITKKFML